MTAAAASARWDAVVLPLRAQVADRLASHAGTAPLPLAQRRALAERYTGQVLDAYAQQLIGQGDAPLSAELEDRLARSIVDHLTGAGGFQALLDDARVENIDANGCDQVFVRYTDGHVERAAPIASSDEELVDLVRSFVTAAAFGADEKTTGEERAFDRTNPYLDLQLPDGSRLCALMSVTRRPPEAGSDTQEAEDDAGASAPDDETTALAWSGRKARIRLFGTPTVLDVTEPGKPLRSKAAEVAAFLACHPGGVDTRTIGENLEPGVRLRSADVRVHTNVHNLRHVLGRAAGPLRLGYVVNSAGRYRLDPTTVEVDLWQFRELLAAARTADGPQRIDLLRQACVLYTAPLAEACDYEWIEPHREKARQQATDAHTLLADALPPSNPEEAADVLDRAIGHDPYNESLYRHAMRARHALGDHDAVRALVQSLTVALADLDAEPDEATIELARQLRGRPSAPRTSREHGTSSRGTPSLSGGGPAARTPRRE